MTIQTPNIAQAIKKKSLRDNCIGSIKIKNKKFSQSRLAVIFVRFINRYLYPVGLGAAINRYDSSITLYSSRGDKKLYSGFDRNAAFCNFGSGAFQHPRWKNYDYPGVSEYYKTLQGTPYKDFFPIDLCVENLILPFENNSVSLIYCAHTLEHLEEGKAIHFLSECARILRPSGVMRIAVPNTDSDFSFSKLIYAQKNISKSETLASMRSSAVHLFRHTENLSDDQLLNDMPEANFNTEEFMRIATQVRGLSNKFNGEIPESHITHWNHAKLAALSGTLGFKCYLPLYRGSTSQAPFSNIEVFDTTEPHLSLYGEFIGANNEESR